MISPHVPSWFLKELKIIDQTYRIQDTDDHDGYFIVKDLKLSLLADGGKSIFTGSNKKVLVITGPRVVLWIPSFGEQMLEKLREMKLKAIEMGVFDNPLNELAYYKNLEKKAKEKKMNLAVDMISEGLMEGHKLARKKSFSYGGEK